MGATGGTDIAFEDWKERARSSDILEAANARGAQLRRQGHEWVGPCPACGGEDRFQVNQKDRVFMCRGSVGGDVIALVQHLEGVEFIQACESLTGEPPPRGEQTERDPELERERREERRDREVARDLDERAERERKVSMVERVWEDCIPITGTHADAYLRRRKIAVSANLLVDVRFCASLTYQGYRDEAAEEQADLGTFPAMVAAIRDVDGALIGLHRTYLDPDEPRKLIPPGDRKRNKAKKVLGNARNGAIWLGPAGTTVAMAEGIETALSWYCLGVGPEDVTPVAAVSLGNLAGGATGSIRARGRTIPNADPDPEKPGVLLPDSVSSIILLGDGDSDAAFTRGSLMTAARRYRAGGREVLVHMAPEISGRGADWNDVLIANSAG